MSILASDLVFFGSAAPYDTPFGGGRRLGSAVQTGTENNLFPDVPAAFRRVGGMQLRKFYPSVISANAEPLMQAQLLISTPPADPAVESTIFAFGNELSTVADVYKTVATYERSSAGTAVPGVSFKEVAVGAYTRWRIVGGASAVEIGRSYQLTYNTGGTTGYTVTDRTTVLSRSGPNADGLYEFTGSVEIGRPAAAPTLQYLVPLAPPLVLCGASGVSAISASGATVTRYKVLAPGGTVALPLFRAGESVLVSQGSTSEFALIASVTDGQITFAANLAGSYTTAAIISSMIALGDLQALAGPSFSQQTWTRVYSDVPVSAPISAAYDRGYAITVTNQGAITDRWAFIFTGPTAFKCIGEQAGSVGTGSTTAAFAPTNPLTGAPYFSIPAAGWGDGWAIGNVWRLDTVGAYAHVWEMRRVTPSAAAGVTSSVKQFRGSVNA